MRIAIYARVSTQRQAEAQTIDEQIERLREHARSRGLELPEANVFRDDGYSGARLSAAPAWTASARRPPWPPSTRSS